MQGKAAVRLRARPREPAFDPLPTAGIHGFGIPRQGRRTSGGRSHHCYGYGAPVILHYPNANFEYWVSKYRYVCPTCSS